MNWERLDAEMPPNSREESFGQELVIEDVQYEDEGKYECQGINDQAQSPIRRSFDLEIEGIQSIVIATVTLRGGELMEVLEQQFQILHRNGFIVLTYVS